MAVQETVLCSSTKDPKQDESLFEPCFLKQVMCFAGIKVACHKNDLVSS